MNKHHGFFLLEERSCADRKGLLMYLARLVHKKSRCIYCGDSFKQGRDAQNHMIDRQHCFMNSEDFEQYDKFYDFTEENRRVAQRIQEKFGHLKPSDNEFMYSIEPAKVKAIA